MRVLLATSLALLGVTAPLRAAAIADTCYASSCQTTAPTGVSLIQTKPSKHHKGSGTAGTQNHTDLAEERDEREGRRNHAAHSRNQHQAGLAKENIKYEDSHQENVSGHSVMNSSQSAHARKSHQNSLGEEDKRKGAMHHMSGRVHMKATQDAALGCTVVVYRDGAVDCAGLSETFTTTSPKGQEFMLGDNDWASAKVSGQCASVEFYDDDYEHSKQNVQVPGNAGCVRFEWDMKNDMNGFYVVHLPTCTVDLFREGAGDCTGFAEVTFTTAKKGGEEFTPSDHDWIAARVSGDCGNVKFYDDDSAISRQDVEVPGDAGCVQFALDVKNDMNGVYIMPADAVSPPAA